MARIRTIKPSFFKNEELADLPMTARMLFIGLWTLADREGRLEDRHKRIKVEIFPYDTVDIDSLLSRLQSAGFIMRYGVGEMKVIQIINFSKHQRVSGTEATTPSELPPYEEGSSLEAVGKQSGSTQDDRKGKEYRKGKEREFSPPTNDEVIEYFKANGYAKELADKAYLYYSAADWHDKDGKPVKSWKQKMINWFKDDYKLKPESSLLKTVHALKAKNSTPGS